MRFKTWNDVEKAGYTGECGPLFRIDTVVFSNYIEPDGSTHCLDSCFWENDEGTDISPIDCFFTSIDEARAYARLVTQDMVLWFKNNGNGKNFDHVSIEVIQMAWEDCSGKWAPGEWVPSYAVSTYDWMWGVRLEEWHDLDISDERACRL